MPRNPTLRSATPGPCRYVSTGPECEHWDQTLSTGPNKRNDRSASEKRAWQRKSGRDCRPDSMRMRKLVTVGHSYVVSLNRRLAHEMAIAGRGKWDVTCVAPEYFHGGNDLAPL